MEDLRIRRVRGGRFEVRLPAEERRLLEGLPGELRSILRSEDPALERLFPSAYREDPELDREFRQLTRDELLDGRLSSLEVMEATLGEERLDEEQLLAWLGAVNDLRLVLGSRLEITHDDQALDVEPDDPRAPVVALYHYLTWLEAQMIDALADGLEAGADG